MSSYIKTHFDEFFPGLGDFNKQFKASSFRLDIEFVPENQGYKILVGTVCRKHLVYVDEMLYEPIKSMCDFSMLLKSMASRLALCPTHQKEAAKLIDGLF